MQSLMRRAREALIGSPLEDPARHAFRFLGRRKPTANDVNDARTIEIARRVLPQDGVAIDVGAHRGAILKHLVQFAPAGRHIAIEPLPRYAKALRRRFPTVEVVEAAVAAEPGVTQFREVISSPEQSSIAGHGHDAPGAVRYFDVRVVTLDEVAPDHVDFVKIDAEQAEYEILLGAKRVLAMKPVIVFELGANQEAVWNLLIESGFLVNRLAGWLNAEPPPGSVHALRHDVTGEHVFVAYPIH